MVLLKCRLVSLHSQEVEELKAGAQERVVSVGDGMSSGDGIRNVVNLLLLGELDVRSVRFGRQERAHQSAGLSTHVFRGGSG